MFKFVIFFAVVSVACAATFRGYLPKKPEELAHKEGCYIPEIKDVIPFGTQVKPIGHCVRIHCGSGLVDYASCGVVGTDDPKCYVTEGDLEKPYPECCPNVECESDNYVV